MQAGPSNGSREAWGMPPVLGTPPRVEFARDDNPLPYGRGSAGAGIRSLRIASGSVCSALCSNHAVSSGS
jgi:hypothetical protein